MMKLETERLLLAPCTEEALVKYSAKQYKLGPHIENYLEELKHDESVLGWGVWLVIDKQTNKIIGDLGFKEKPDKNKTVEIGYGITPAQQNKGYATEALKAIINWAFDSNLVHIITAECLEENASSIRVLEKLRMEKVRADHQMLYWQLTK